MEKVQKRMILNPSLSEARGVLKDRKTSPKALVGVQRLIHQQLKHLREGQEDLKDQKTRSLQSMQRRSVKLSRKARIPKANNTIGTFLS